MKIGLKVFPDITKASINKIIDLVDFIEVYAIVGSEYRFIKEYKKPIVVHCEHSGQGVNLCDKTKTAKNLEALNWSKYLADKLGSKKIIIHPGDLDDKNCSFDTSVAFVKANYDKRLIVETMPYIIDKKRGQLICNDNKELKKYMKKCNLGFCLDLNHSIGSAVHRKKDWKKVVKSLIALGPDMYHISDVNISKGDEVHLNLFEGEIDFHYLKEIIPKKAWATLETPSIIKKQIESIKFLKV